MIYFNQLRKVNPVKMEGNNPYLFSELKIKENRGGDYTKSIIKSKEVEDR